MPVISFVMPTKNRAAMIGESIQSVVDQTFKDWELVIADGGDDNTEEVVKSFNDDRIRYFKVTTENGTGIVANRNFGNQMARGEYISIIDSDDLCYPERAELTLKEFERTGCDLVYGKMHLWNPETGEVKEREPKDEARDFNLDDFTVHDFVPHSTVTLKRKLALDFPYNSFFAVCEDMDMISRLYAYGFKFSFLNEHLIKYRVHQDSVMKSGHISFKYTKLVIENRGWMNDKLKEQYG